MTKRLPQTYTCPKCSKEALKAIDQVSHIVLRYGHGQIITTWFVCSNCRIEFLVKFTKELVKDKPDEIVEIRDHAMLIGDL